MNIIDVYKKKLGHFIILISGLYGTGKSKVADILSKELNLKHLSLFEYYIHKNIKIIEIDAGKRAENIYDIDIIDWNKLNEDIEKYKDGVILTGIGFPEGRIKIKPVIHVNLRTSKEEIMKRRNAFLERHKNDFPELYKHKDTEVDKIIIDKYMYPFYKKIIDESRINRFINIKDLKLDEVIDVVFNTVMKLIQDEIYRGNDNVVWDRDKNEYRLK